MIKVCEVCNNEFNTYHKDARFCNADCHKEFQYQEYIEAWQLGLVDGCRGDPKYGNVSRHVKKFVLNKFKTCQSCGIDSWNGKPITLELEHIDGISSNNAESNLTVLCPNCHSQTNTYRGKNRGNGRERY